MFRDGGLINLGHGHGIGGLNHGIGDPCLVLSSDPKPRLRWTAELHERFLKAVTQLGGPNKATPKAIMRTMSVKGLTLFHLKSHLQKYRLGLQSGKDMCDIVNHGPYLVEGPESNDSASKLLAPDTTCGFEVKEALRVQMEIQSKLHLQIEAEKRLQIRQDAERRYMSMLDSACKLLADHYLGAAVIDEEKDKSQRMWTNKSAPAIFAHNIISNYILRPSTVAGLHGLEELLPNLPTASCLTSHDSPTGMLRRKDPGLDPKKRMLNADLDPQCLLWGESNLRMPNVCVSQGIIRYST